MQKFDRDCNKLKKSNRAYPKIHRVLIRSDWSPVRVRVNERACCYYYIYNYRFFRSAHARHTQRGLNVPHNVRPKSQRRDERRPTCGGCKKSEEIRRIRLRSKWTYKEKTRGSSTLSLPVLVLVAVDKSTDFNMHPRN